jgi:pimeloyl-ACP methyl ester carboxylesterase
VQNNTVLIVAPIWLNEVDQRAGSVQAKELYFKSSNWQAGGSSVGPSLQHSLSAYSIMDNFTDMLFDKAVYPNLNQVVIAGHSMGGQASHRYAILKKQKKYDDDLSYWVGNPGSWTFLSTDRPYHNDSCSAIFDNWHYGIGGNVSKITRYARADVVADKDAVVTRYLNRKVHMALGLL